MKTEELLESRGSTHGDYNEVARLSQMLKRVMRSSRTWDGQKESTRESLDMIAAKIARVLSGNADFADHWDDIMGYAALVARTLKEKQ